MYKILRKIGEVSYELLFPTNNRIHNIFHVSQLKNVLGKHVTSYAELLPLDDEGKLILEIETILNVGETRLRNKIISKSLVNLKEMPI